MKFIFPVIIITTLVSLIFGMDKKKKKHRKLKTRFHAKDEGSSSQMNLPPVNLTNRTLLPVQYQNAINITYRPLYNEEVFRLFQNWDYNMQPYEIQEIFQYMLFRQEGRVTQDSLKIFYAIFVQKFQECDPDKSNSLTFDEWAVCLKNETDFRYIKPPIYNYTSFNPVLLAPVNFYGTLFELLDYDKKGYINFHDYMKFRLYVFSWKFCSVHAPYLLEAEFECSLSISTQMKYSSRAKIRNLYQFWLSQSSNQSMRNFDFTLFTIVTHGARLFALINNKNDNDISRKEFELALDKGVLPKRYNQDNIDYFFKLTENKNHRDSGIDLQTFIFYDYHLILFDSNSISRMYYIKNDEYFKLLNSMFFPNNTLAEMYMSPTYNLTPSSYNLYQFANITIFNSERDFFYKFSQVENKDKSELVHKKSKLKTRSRNRQIESLDLAIRVQPNGYHYFNVMYNITLQQNVTFQKFFDLLDTRQNGYINFYDYANLVQIGYIYCLVDKDMSGVVTASNLYDYLSTYSNLPTIGYHLVDRAYRLTQFDNDLYFDFYTFVTLMKMDDLVAHYFRETYQALIYEIELKKLLKRTNMYFLPDTILNQCLRGMDTKNVPLYDWECAFKFGITKNLDYFRGMNNYQISKMNNLTISNTAVYNIDPNYI